MSGPVETIDLAGQPKVPEGGFSVLSVHSQKCRLPVADVIVGIGPNGAVVTIEHFVHSRGRKHPKLCFIEVG